MGHIKTTEQDNGQLLVEITYGGAESPFGGIDSSAPPAYIDPKCFAASDGFLVLDEKLVSVGLSAITLPSPMFNGVSGVQLLGFGTFYNSIYKQLNYALGVIITPYAANQAAGTSSGVTYTFYLTSWNPSNPALFNTDVLPISLGATFQPGIQASLTLDVLYGGGIFETTGAGASGSITAVGGGGTLIPGSFTVSGGTGWVLGQIIQLSQGTSSQWAQVTGVTSGGAILTVALLTGLVGTGFTTGAFSSITSPLAGTSTLSFPTLPGAPVAGFNGATTQAAATALAAAINGNSLITAYLTAAVSADGTQVVLTAISAGTASNSIQVVDTTRTLLGSGGVFPTAFYTSAKSGRYLQGGTPYLTVNPPATINGKASIAEVGGTLYVGNVGPFILQYAGPGTLTTCTMYTGVNVLRKFNGSLVGLGLVPQLNQVYQNKDMIFAWSAATELTTWSPINGAGLVTGAGFNQLSDIDDALTGMIVSNNTAIILRQQGVSYATALQNGIDPYDFAHVALGDRGEGCQIPQLVCQYDQMGVYVGNSNIYGFANSPSPIGEKIKNSFWAFLNILPDPIPTSIYTLYKYFMDSAAVAIYAGNTMCPHFAFLLGQTIYIYNGTDGAWTQVGLNIGIPVGGSYYAQWYLGVVSNSSLQSTNQAFSQGSLALMVQSTPDLGGTSSYEIYALSEHITNGSAYIDVNNTQTVTFPQEEILFGRDVTIDGFYVSLFFWGTTSLTLDFNINGNLVATLVLPAVAGPLPSAPSLYQVQCPNTTAKSPQLTISTAWTSGTGFGQLQIAKATMFATIDPNQRPI